MTIRDNRDCIIRVLLYSYYTTITGLGVLLRNIAYVYKELKASKREKGLTQHPCLGFQV